ncbi:hypothetical protein Tco_0898713 [Tanacetum coccineum]
MKGYYDAKVREVSLAQETSCIVLRRKPAEDAGKLGSKVGWTLRGTCAAGNVSNYLSWQFLHRFRITTCQMPLQYIPKGLLVSEILKRSWRRACVLPV